MKHSVMLTIASLLSILFMTFHLTDDFLHEKGGMSQIGFFVSVIVIVVWLYGTLVLAERRSGYIIMLVGSIVGSSMGVMHTLGGAVPNSRGFFFIWTLLALGVTGTFSFILSVHGLWSLQKGRPR